MKGEKEGKSPLFPHPTPNHFGAILSSGLEEKGAGRKLGMCTHRESASGAPSSPTLGASPPYASGAFHPNPRTLTQRLDMEAPILCREVFSPVPSPKHNLQMTATQSFVSRHYLHSTVNSGMHTFILHTKQNSFLSMLNIRILVHQCNYLHLKISTIIFTISLILKANSLYYLCFYNNIWIILLLMLLLLKIFKLPYTHMYIQ